jgi:hypothetical protein
MDSPQPRGPLFRTDLEANTESFVRTALDRWGTGQTIKGLEETEGTARVRFRQRSANVRALNLAPG